MILKNHKYNRYIYLWISVDIQWLQQQPGSPGWPADGQTGLDNNNLLESAGFQADSHSGKFFRVTYNVEEILKNILTTHPPGNITGRFLNPAAPPSAELAGCRNFLSTVTNAHKISCILTHTLYLLSF